MVTESSKEVAVSKLKRTIQVNKPGNNFSLKDSRGRFSDIQTYKRVHGEAISEEKTKREERGNIRINEGKSKNDFCVSRKRLFLQPRNRGMVR